ncbi:MAG: radical SAM protein [Lachnospiraceae bacterium]|nr:radical SAM protein [Lachnospiraceae bacterium]
MKKVYDTDWNCLTDVIAYGLGQVGRRYIDLFMQKFGIKYIVDNNENHPDEYYGIPVISLKQMLEKRQKEKIIVFASRKAFYSICADLIQNGLIENRDFCKFDDFIKDWYWQFERKNCLREVHMAINTDCTFKCKNCNMFMPYYNHVIQYSFKEVEKDLSLFFARIDYVFTFSFLGGEPFLNYELDSMIEFLFQNYSMKIGRIEVITNGSLIPGEKVLGVLKNCNVMVRISDYTSQIPYANRMNDLCSILERYKVSYSVQKSLQWTDFCFPNNEDSVKISDIRNHMLCCAPEFHGVNDGKFYYCHVAWSAEKAGLFQLRDSDYLDLELLDGNSKTDCRRIIEHANGNVDGGYVSLCAKCMGCGSDNKRYISVGEQLGN